jgi:hypothetical protein
MILQTTETRAEYDLAHEHPWFEPTGFDWLLEVAGALCLLFGLLAVVV